LFDGGAEAALLLFQGSAANGEDGFFYCVGFGLCVVNRDEEGGEEAAVVFVGEGADGVGAVGAVAELVGYFADIGTDGGKLALVLVPCSFSYEIGFG
jgi:hypothetical protein